MSNKISSTNGLLILFLALIWGSSFILMKEGLYSFTAPQVAALRLISASIVLLPIVLANLKKINKKLLGKMLLVGLIGIGIPAYLFTWAELHISSSLAGILNSLTPIFALTIGILFFHLKSNWIKATGIIIGFTGCIMLILVRNTSVSSEDAKYGWAIVLATVMYGTSVNLVRKYLKNVSSLLIVSFALIFLGAVSSVYLFSTDFLQRISNIPLAWHSIIYVFILGAIGTSFANIISYRLVQNIGPVNASMVTFLIPIVALVWGWLAGEPIGIAHFGSLLLILTAVYIVMKA